MAKDSTLKLGYPLRTKLMLCIPVAACMAGVVNILATLERGISIWLVSVLVGSVLAGLPAVYAFRASYIFDGSGVSRQSLLGLRRYRREDFVSYERIAAEPGAPPDLLLRFKSGVVFIGALYVDRTAQEVVDFLRAEWKVSAEDYEAPPLGAVDPLQCFEYETLHVGVLLAIGVLSVVVALQVHVFAMLAVLGAFCFRAAWRAMGTVETDEQGLTFRHRYQKSVTLAWSEIESVAYWSSFAQGGARILGKGGQKIRVYRWVARYPMFNRLMHDRLDVKVFWPNLQLPARVDLNRRRRLGVVAPYALLMLNALELLLQGNHVTFLVVAAIPTFVAAAMIWGSSRSLEFNQHEIRDIWRYMWFVKVSTYRRADLVEARLGRQLTVGGLWMRFGDTRLEITNSDASLPPEQILTCLREQWAWEQKPGGQFEPVQLHKAA